MRGTRPASASSPRRNATQARRPRCVHARASTTLHSMSASTAKTSESSPVGRDVGLVDGEVEVGQHLHGLEQDASLPGAVDLHHGSAPRIISHRRREQEGTRQEAGDTGETARRLAHLHERGRGADSIVDKASGGCSAAASRRRGRALLATSQRAQLAVAGREAAEEGGGRKKIRQRERRGREMRGERSQRRLRKYRQGRRRSLFVPGAGSTRDKRLPFVPGGGSTRDKKVTGSFVSVGAITRDKKLFFYPGWCLQPG